MLQFGRRKFKTSAPDDLDGALIETTGCDATEVARMLDGEPLAHFVAKAAMPFIVEVVVLHELTDVIAKAGAHEAAAKVRALYARLKGK